jgi:hypothetical protein
MRWTGRRATPATTTTPSARRWARQSTPTPNQNNNNKYTEHRRRYGDLDTRRANPTATDFLYTDNIAAGGSSSFIVNLAASGPRLSGQSIVRYNVFKTNNGTR